VAPTDSSKDATGSMFVGFYLPFMVGFVMLMLRETDGVARIVAFIAITVCNDVGGYFAGVLFGKHPIAPQISPKKSWEGFAGSVALSVAVAIPLFAIAFGATWWQAVIFGMIMPVTATAGDFIESAIKRDLDVKDMSNIIPGHGGLMDRLDSLIPNAFVSWALLGLFLG
jgi:phosphatidate cytidylyltransferase